MRILFLSQVVPYPTDAGPKVRAHYVLRQLARAHRVTLVCFRRPGDRTEALAQLGEWCHAVHALPIDRARWRDALALARGLADGTPFVVRRDERRAMHALIARLCAEQRFDSVHADQLPMAQFALRAPVRRRVLDQHNAVWSVVRGLAALERTPWRRALLEREWRALRAYEGKTARAFDAVAAVSPADAARLAAAGARDNVHVIPIGVEPDADRSLIREPGARGVTFIGTMLWPPNADGARWFTRRVWPTILGAVPRVHFDLVGERPSIGSREAAAASIRVHGYAPDLGPVLAGTAVCVAPLRSGSGMRVKILEAWARGLPVVSTTVGAEGIDARDGENILLADSAADFATAVIALLEDPARAERLGAAGRATVRRSYDWRALYPRVAALHDPAGAGPPSP